MCNNKVPFDPGYSKFSAQIPQEVTLVLDQIAGLKKPHQKKFEFQKFEMQVAPAIKNSAAIYLGCILWGSYLSHRYKDDPKEISGNVMKEIPQEQQENFDHNKEIDFLTDFIDKLDKSSIYYLKRPAKSGKELIPYLEAYREFTALNNNFFELDSTDQIKLPGAVAHFENYDAQKLDELKLRIEEIINSGKIDRILELGFYQG